MEELDVWRTAALLMRLHGEAATFNAAQRADALRERGDGVGAAVWVKVIHAIKQHELQKPLDGEALH